MAPSLIEQVRQGSLERAESVAQVSQFAAELAKRVVLEWVAAVAKSPAQKALRNTASVRK